jgi:hypothetical protein
MALSAAQVELIEGAGFSHKKLNEIENSVPLYVSNTADYLAVRNMLLLLVIHAHVRAMQTSFTLVVHTERLCSGCKIRNTNSRLKKRKRRPVLSLCAH